MLSATCATTIGQAECGIDSDCVEGGVTGVCEANLHCSFADSNCPSGRRYSSVSGGLSDQCVAVVLCGDALCTGDESCDSCDSDCGSCDDPLFCGDEICAETSESCASCERDCGECGETTCGDEVCNGEETCADCAFDCGACGATCGDGSCNGEETCANCGIDCGTCSDEICDDGIDNDLDGFVDEGCDGPTY